MTRVEQALEALIEAEREAQRWHDALVAASRDDRQALIAALRRRVDEASDTEDDATVLVAVARVLGDLAGEDVAEMLIDVLASEQPAARAAAGEQLQELAFDRFKEVAVAVERAVERLPGESPALVELPYLLSEVGEGGVGKLLAVFLDHGDPDVVAAGIEALVELGDPAASRWLEPLVDDERVTELQGERATISELASDARALMERMEGATA